MNRTPNARPLLTVLTLSLLGSAALAQPQVTLNFWTHSHPPMIAVNKQLIAEYQKANPNIKINYQTFPTDEYLTKLKAALATGSGPDVFDLFDGDLQSYFRQRQLAPIDPKALGFQDVAAMKKNWLQGSLEGSSFGGQVYQLPMEFNTFSLFINTDLYRKAGLNPDTDAPKTWADLARVGQKIAKFNGTVATVEGFKWPVPKLGDVWAQITFEPLLRQYGGSVLSADGNSSAINSPQAVKALTTYGELITRYKTGDQNGGKYDPLNPNEDFAQGTLANWISGPWAVATLKGKPVDGKYKVVPLPQVNPARPVTLLYSWGWSVNAASRNKPEAMKWLNFLSSRGELWLKDVGYIQPRLGWEATPTAKTTPYLNVFLNDMKLGQYTVRSTNYAEITKIVNNMLQRVILQRQAPQAAADQAKREIDDTLK